MSDDSSRSGGFPWGAVLTGLVILTILAAVLGAPMVLQSRREKRYLEIMGGLKSLASAEADFRRNDRDGNKVNDFWTGDVAGLCTLRFPADGNELRLIDPALARADARPILPLALTPEPMDEHLFQALDQDNAVKGDPEWIYRMDTDRSGKKVHNLYKFGFCGYPLLREPGRKIFIINENNTIFHRLDGKLHFNWPDDYELKYNYSADDF